MSKEKIMGSVWTSRKFILPALGIILLAVVPMITGKQVDWQVIVGTITIVMGFMGGESFKDLSIAKQDANVLQGLFEKIEIGNKWTDPRFLLSVLGIVVISILPQFGIELEWDKVVPVAGLFGSWLVGDGWKNKIKIDAISSGIYWDIKRKNERSKVNPSL